MKLFNTLKITIVIVLLTFSYWAKCQVPVADFSYSTPTTFTVAFQDLSTNNPTSWEWLFDDGNIGFAQNPVHVYSNPGTYQVCLTASNASGASAQVCKNITVYNNSALAAQLFTQNVCVNSQVIVQPQITGGTPPYTYYWSSVGDSLSCTTCKNPQATITQQSVYTLTVTDIANTSVTAEAFYSTNPNVNEIEISAGGTGISCLSPIDTTTLIIIDTNGSGPYRINWGDGDTLLTNSSASHFYTEASNYIITVANNANCTASMFYNIPFNGIVVSALQTAQPYCQSDSTGKIKIAAIGGTAPYNYLWNNGSTLDSITNLKPGSYRVTVIDQTACSFAKTFNLPPVSGWSYYAHLEISAVNCSNAGSIQTTMNGGTPPFTYLWNNGTTTQYLTTFQPSLFSVTVTDGNGCQTSALASVGTGCFGVITGKIFSDANSNCTIDSSEQILPNILVEASNGSQSYYGYTNANGIYAINVSYTGTYVLQPSLQTAAACANFTFCGNNGNTVTVTNLGDTISNRNFAYTATNNFDLRLRAVWGPGNPGFIKNYMLYYGNYSLAQYNGQPSITFAYDTNLIYQSSTLPAMHNVANHTLTWLLPPISYNFNLWVNSIGASFLVPQTVGLGYMVQSNFLIEPTTGDCDSANNRLITSDIVTGSYDPNEKKVEPAGDILEEDSILTYTIGFQNTGTDSTHFIILKDTLSPYLDPATVRNIASSHPYSDFSISGTGILTWTFNPLRLVDSFTNEPGSHGFVKFTIKKKKNLPLNTVISNTAHIYFDYNEAVVTNTVANTLTEPNGIWHIRSTEGITVKAFPNPFSEGTSIMVEGVTGCYDFELYDVTGKLNKRLTSIETNQFFVNRENLSSGVYFFKVLSADKKKSGYGKLVVE